MSLLRLFRNFIIFYRWVVLFTAVILLSIAFRAPFLHKGHEDEVHSIGRSLNMIWTGDLNPHLFLHPTGTMYICIPWNILALASMSREVGGEPYVSGGSPLEVFHQELNGFVQVQNFIRPEVSPNWDQFRYRVRWMNMLLIPVQILLLAYIGWRLNLMVPAFAAAILLAFCDSSIRDSVYVSVNSTTATFVILSVAACAFFTHFFPLRSMRVWLAQIALISFFIGMAVACKYNAGTFILVPLIFGYLTLKQLIDGGRFPLEKMFLAFFVACTALAAGFTVLCPYWYSELALFVRNVLYQIWYFKVGHKPWNTFNPGLEMLWINLRCMADQYSWIGFLFTIFSIIYIFASGLFRSFREEGVFFVFIPALVGCVAFFVLMSNQAVFFDRNFSIYYSTWFFCSALSWWYVSGDLARRWTSWEPVRVRVFFTLALTAYCIIQTSFIDYLFFKQSREWWRQNEAVWKAIQSWFS